MAAPEYVPTRPNEAPRAYHSAPRRDDEWLTDRPAEVVGEGGQPDIDAGRMGAPGPDQGYVLTLVPLVRPLLHLGEGEDIRDVEAGAVAIATKRSSLFGRAPVVHDLRVAYTVWGALDPHCPSDLAAERRRRFEGIHLIAHHYPELRAVVDAVPESTLRLSPAEASERYAAGWQDLLVL